MIEFCRFNNMQFKGMLKRRLNFDVDNTDFLLTISFLRYRSVSLKRVDLCPYIIYCSALARSSIY